MNAASNETQLQVDAADQCAESPGYLDVQGFYPHAPALRSEFVAHFARPYGRFGDIQQIWDYWHVPEMYTYLRTNPAKILSKDVLSDFRESLRWWCIENLGLGNISDPYLSMYVNGCSQALHTDSKNGRFGYVFSLTEFESRCFEGGETILLKPDAYWNTKRIERFAAGSDLQVLVPPLFNQLLVFDDRLIHGVRIIQGAMNPMDSRVVIHGHISESGILIEGPLDLNLASQEIEGVVAASLDESEFIGEYHGFLTVRMNVSAAGTTGDVRVLCNRLLPTSPSTCSLAPFIRTLRQLLASLKFPIHETQSTITLPIVVDSQ